MKELLDTIPQTGRIEWMGVRPDRRRPLRVLDEVTATMTGLAGDRFGGGEQAERQVTLIQHEHLSVVASILQQETIDPAVVRRNLVVSGINLVSLKDKTFRIGDAVFFGTGNCPPCSRMEENLGAGGYNAMRGHGGITAYIVQPGTIRVGDVVAFDVANDSRA